MNPVNRFGAVPEERGSLGAVLAMSLGNWSFQLYPQLWNLEEVDLIAGLQWKTLKFDISTVATDLQNIPVGPGVYLWVVRGRIDILPDHSYIFYVGKAEAGLQKRYKEYVEEREGAAPEDDRPQIVKLLNYFTDNLYFCHTELTKDQCGIIESALKDNITPPANTILKLKGRLYP